MQKDRAEPCGQRVRGAFARNGIVSRFVDYGARLKALTRAQLLEAYS
jgi:hypothetical protein